MKALGLLYQKDLRRAKVDNNKLNFSHSQLKMSSTDFCLYA